jgi:hypothetical protein
MLPLFTNGQVSFGLNSSGGMFTLKNNDHTFVLNSRKINRPILGGNFEFKMTAKSTINLQYDWSSLTVEGTQFGHVFYPPSGISFDRHNISAQYFYSILPRLYLGFGYSKSLANNFYMIDFHNKYKLYSRDNFDIDIISFNTKYEIYKRFYLTANYNRAISFNKIKFPKFTEFSYIQVGLGYSVKLF